MQTAKRQKTPAERWCSTPRSRRAFVALLVHSKGPVHSATIYSDLPALCNRPGAERQRRAHMAATNTRRSASHATAVTKPAIFSTISTGTPARTIEESLVGSSLGSPAWPVPMHASKPLLIAGPAIGRMDWYIERQRVRAPSTREKTHRSKPSVAWRRKLRSGGGVYPARIEFRTHAQSADCSKGRGFGS